VTGPLSRAGWDQWFDGLRWDDVRVPVASIISLLYTPAAYRVVTAALFSRLRDASPFDEYSALSGCVKIRFTHNTPVKYDRRSNGFKNLRMLKMAVQQGRSERRGEAYASVR